MPVKSCDYEVEEEERPNKKGEDKKDEEKGANEEGEDEDDGKVPTNSLWRGQAHFE